MALTSQQETSELLMIEEADAWFEYQEATRGQNEPRYAEVEPWAWRRLQRKLARIRQARANLRAAPA